MNFNLPPRNKQSDLVNQILSTFSEQRGIPLQTEKSGESTLANLSSLNFSPWDYNLDSNIEIKTEKDLAVDARDFELPNTVEQTGNEMTIGEYTNWCETFNTGTGCNNTVSYAAIRNESEAYEEQYLSLKFFLAGCHGHYKKELSQILFPIFVHFYLDLIHKPDLISAQSFYNKFHSEHEEVAKSDILYNLTKISSTTQIILYNNIYTFRKGKYYIRLSPMAYIYLIEHLRHGNSTLVLQTFNLYFVLKAEDYQNENHHEASLIKLEKSDLSHAMDLSIASENSVDSFMEAKRIIADVAEMSPNIKPSICFYSFSNTQERICCASFSNDCKYIAAGCNNSSINIWRLQPKFNNDQRSSGHTSDATDGVKQLVASKDHSILRGHQGSVFAAKFLQKDSDYLISGSQDKSVILWDVSARKALVQYKAHTRTIWDVCTSSTNSFFASCSWDQTVRLWNTEYAYPLRLFAGHYDSVNCVQFHPNGNFLASGSTDKTVRLWDLQSGQFVRLLVGHQGTIRCLAFTHDGKYLVSAGEESLIYIWDLRNGKKLKKIKGHQKIIYSLSFNQDDQVLACAGLDSFISVWDSDTIFKKEEPAVLNKETDAIGCYSTKSNVVYSLTFPKNQTLFAACHAEKR